LRLFVLLLLVCLPLAGQIGGSLHALEHVEGAECGHHVHSNHGEDHGEDDCRLCLLQPLGVDPPAAAELSAPVELGQARVALRVALDSRAPLAFRARGPPARFAA
jgi:DUF2946 family protein